VTLDAGKTLEGPRGANGSRVPSRPPAAVEPVVAAPLWLARTLARQRAAGRQSALMAVGLQGRCGNRAAVHLLARQPTGVSEQEKTRESLAKRKGGRHGFVTLTKGTMEWWLAPSDGPDASAKIQIKFTPKPGFTPKTITFLQTVHTTPADNRNAGMPKIDIHPGEYVPFYGADWGDKTKDWQPEGAPPGYENQPSSSTDPAAYLYDAPLVYSGMAKRFESVAVVPETSEILGSLTWGVDEDGLFGGEEKDCTDRPTAGFLVAIDRFYAKPATVGPDPEREERYDAILDGFQANAGGFAGLYNASHLTLDHEKQLTPIVNKMLGDRKLAVLIGGFADGNEQDPMGTSEARAREVARFLKDKGVPESSISLTGFGASWARFAPGAKENRNRRVQIRLRYP
jgi:OmpA family protein